MTIRNHTPKTIETMEAAPVRAAHAGKGRAMLVLLAIALPLLALFA